MPPISSSQVTQKSLDIAGSPVPNFWPVVQTFRIELSTLCFSTVLSSAPLAVTCTSCSCLSTDHCVECGTVARAGPAFWRWPGKFSGTGCSWSSKAVPLPLFPSWHWRSLKPRRSYRESLTGHSHRSRLSSRVVEAPLGSSVDSSCLWFQLQAVSARKSSTEAARKVEHMLKQPPKGKWPCWGDHPPPSRPPSHTTLQAGMESSTFQGKVVANHEELGWSEGDGLRQSGCTEVMMHPTCY